MAERNLDFDTIIDRKNTDCLKYDFAKRRRMPEDVLPLWVADMDFKTSSYVEDALAERARHGIFGYSESQTPYFEIVRDWMKRHHDWEVKEPWLIKTPGVVFALAMAVKAYTEPGDGVLIQSPVYYPFSEVIEDNGRRIVSNTLVLGEDHKYHIDFASKFGIEYVMIDEGWYSFCDKNMLNPRADLNLSELCAYAQERGVRIILWAVGHTLEKDAEEICAHYAAMGIAGFKVDFFEAQDQNVVETLYYLAEVTAKHKLLLNIHGTFKPTGLSRTYPNVMNYEGVYGLEQMKWTDKDKANMPLNDVLIPYIRMAAGPLDYTQGAMLNASKNDYRSIDHMAMSQGTRAHQLALYVIFDSPLSMLCDSPSIYLREEECTRFITSIPTCFEKSFVVDGKVGETVIIARKNGENWYVGGITSWNPIDYSLDLSFLEEGEWTAEIIKDGVNSNRIGFDYKKQVLTLSLIHI